MMKQKYQRILAVLLMLALMVVGLPISVSAETVNEDGYIEVRTVEDLYMIRNDLTAKYILMNDIDLTEATAEGGDWDFNGKGWNPIGSDDTYSNQEFSGEFDGNGHSIIGIRFAGLISGDNYVGLFSNVSGYVHDLTMEQVNVDISCYDLKFGIIAARLQESGVVENCSVSGNISFYFNDADRYLSLGGLVGEAAGTIKECFNSADFYYESKYSSEAAAIGGITGSTESSREPVILNCYNTGNLSGGRNDLSYAISCQKGSTIINCYNIGGGFNRLASWAFTTVENSYCLTGSVDEGNGGVTNLTKSQMLIQDMYVGFDFENVWIQNPNANYPYPQLRSNVQDTDAVVKTLRILSYPTKTDYYTGDPLDFSGCLAEAVYISGRTEMVTVTEDMVSGYDSSAIGRQTVTVTYNGASDTFEVNVTQRPKAISMALKSEPNTKEFIVGGTFDFTGAVIEVAFDNATTVVVPVTEDMTTGGNINHIGDQTITVHYEGLTTSFKVKVLPVTVVELELTSAPDKLTYLEGQELDLTGMVLTAHLNNGNALEIVNDYTVSGYSGRPGKYTVAITYQQATATFDVVVNEKSLVSLEIKRAPYKTQYISGQELDLDGLVVAGVYDNGENVIIEDYELSGFDGIAGVNTITVTKDKVTTSFTVTVVAKAVSSLEIISLPAKLTYIEHEAFDDDGLVVKASYNDGTEAVITDYELVGFSSSVGTHTVSVAYKGWVDTFEITVTAKKVVDLVVVAPEKLTYFVGEKFDATGMVVTAYYDNHQQIVVDDYVLTGFDSFSAGTKVVYVTYGGMQRNFSVTVAEPSEIKTEGTITVGNAKGNPGDQVVIPVKVNKNTGIAGTRHTITFDPTKLKFVSVAADGRFADGQIVVNTDNAKNGEIVVVWFNAADVTVSGTIYNLTFEILDVNANLTTQVGISFTNNDNGNASGENVLFAPVDGKVDITAYWLGDLDGDRVCKMADLLMLAQYVSGQSLGLTELQKSAADVNENGTVDIHDVVTLSQWLLEADM